MKDRVELTLRMAQLVDDYNVRYADKSIFLFKLLILNLKDGLEKKASAGTLWSRKDDPVFDVYEPEYSKNSITGFNSLGHLIFGDELWSSSCINGMGSEAATDPLTACYQRLGMKLFFDILHFCYLFPSLS